ncbi:SDR family oxidoreductase [Achromobacter aloeverae]|uniref:Short-chain dehydrogenase n=1 Tax=Achromobacter aloeverae TaxID=1750518 RepID=A0A4Q1HFR8_9BURK|nr:SDR family oxidoreductase [Achromobacter aloeverae]RXN85418.1 short-chain dehydrogenase [Achromobacter aloeverae]
MKVQLKPLDQQVVVVTGASSGIGMATALAAAGAGARVVLAARSERALDALASRIRQQGGQACFAVADVGRREDVERIARTALDNYGRVDTWINNAGVSIFGRLDAVADEDSRRLFDTNFWGVVHGSLVALPLLRQQGGALINVGSEASEEAIPLQGMYAASKHAVKGFTDALRVELQEDGAPVSITLIQPTAVNTPFPEHAGNAMPQAPKLPTPMIDPHTVASAILDAATDPARDVKVGAMATVNTLVSKLMPSMADMMGRVQMGRQQRGEPNRDRRGTLYEAGETGRIFGRGDDNAADSKEARMSNTRPA